VLLDLIQMNLERVLRYLGKCIYFLLWTSQHERSSTVWSIVYFVVLVVAVDQMVPFLPTYILESLRVELFLQTLHIVLLDIHISRSEFSLRALWCSHHLEISVDVLGVGRSWRLELIVAGQSYRIRIRPFNVNRSDISLPMLTEFRGARHWRFRRVRGFWCLLRPLGVLPFFKLLVLWTLFIR
jgi:hypothetical protein